MQAHKVTISIPHQLYEFIEDYQAQHQCKGRSEVISTALQLLQQKQLEACYAEANKELQSDFDLTAGDGLENEAW